MSRREVTAIGITNQRETILLCERESGRPLVGRLARKAFTTSRLSVARVTSAGHAGYLNRTDRRKADGRKPVMHEPSSHRDCVPAFRAEPEVAGSSTWWLVHPPRLACGGGVARELWAAPLLARHGKGRRAAAGLQSRPPRPERAQSSRKPRSTGPPVWPVAGISSNESTACPSTLGDGNLRCPGGRSERRSADDRTAPPRGGPARP